MPSTLRAAATRVVPAPALEPCRCHILMAMHLVQAGLVRVTRGLPSHQLWPTDIIEYIRCRTRPTATIVIPDTHGRRKIAPMHALAWPSSAALVLCSGYFSTSWQHDLSVSATSASHQTHFNCSWAAFFKVERDLAFLNHWSCRRCAIKVNACRLSQQNRTAQSDLVLVLCNSQWNSVT